MGVCPVCQSLADVSVQGDNLLVACQGCGRYELSDTVSSAILPRLVDDGLKQAKLRHWLRHGQGSGHVPRLTSDVLGQVLKNPLPTAAESVDYFLEWLATASSAPGVSVKIDWLAASAYMGIAPGSEGFFAKHLEQAGLVTKEHGEFRLSIKGWERLEQIRHETVRGRRIFMAMKFGDDELVEVVDRCFRPAAEDAGFTLFLLTDETPAGIIDNRMRAEIRSCVMLISDLTHANAGAYWEAGFAEGLGRPVLYTCRKDVMGHEDQTKRPHFDTNHCQIIPWVDTDLESVRRALTASICATLPALAKPLAS